MRFLRRSLRRLASSILQRLNSWIFGQRPEFRDSQFASKSDGRDVTRVQSFGCVKVVVDVTLQGMEQLGYSVPAATRPAMTACIS